MVCAALLASSAHAAITHDWPADGDATDTVGGVDGTLVGGTSFAPGLFGQGFAFDGVDDSVTFDTSAGNFGTSDFTIAFVIQTTSADEIAGVLGKREICGFSSFWDIRTGAGLLSLEVYESNVRTGVATTVPINDGLFHTVVFTREGTVVSSYVDGFLNAQYDAGFTANVTNNAVLAAGVSACTGSFDGTVRLTGLLDEIRLADTADPTLLPPVFHCGDGTRDGAVTAADALATLRTAVALETCDLCLCDINGSGTVTAPDALAILQRAVSLPVTSQCPFCPVEL